MYLLRSLSCAVRCGLVPSIAVETRFEIKRLPLNYMQYIGKVFSLGGQISLWVTMSVSSDQFEVFPRLLHLRRIDPVYKMRRYYRMAIQSDLFGKSSLVREWGRIGSRGQMMVETHPDEGQAVNALLKLAQAKQRKGYVL